MRVIVALADAGSIRKAASALETAQPGLTTQLKRIEQELGGALFVRVPRGLVPTALGDLVIAKARDLLERRDSLLSVVRDHGRHADIGKPVRIAGVSGPVVPHLVTSVRTLLPPRQVTSHMEPMIATLLSRLGSCEIDLAVLHEYPGFPLPQPDGWRACTLIPNEPIFVALARQHRLAGREEVDLASLAGEDWTMPPDDDSGLHASFQAACEAAGFAPRLRHITAEAHAACTLISQGQAIACLHPTVIPPPGVVMRPLTGNPHHRRMVLACAQDSFLAGFLAPLTRLVRAHYGKAARASPAYAAWLRSQHRQQSKRGISLGPVSE